MTVVDRLKTALADRYLLERELGEGGMATVYLAHDLKHERPVAIKVLRPELAASLGADRFLREIKLTAKLNHPHILPLLDSGEAEGSLYYVMPFVEGESLRDRLEREKQLPLEEALQITREVADALGSAHARGVIHRDIKPENILLEEGHAVVADFGVARAVSAAGGERLTSTGLAIGTPLYMSPEQATGTVDVDGRADIYALGCVLYEMLAGHPPFTGATAHEVIARHTVDPVPSLRAARDGVPEPVERAVLKALAKTPADRYATTAQFTEALRAAGQEEPADRPKRSRASRRLVALAGVAVLLVGVLGAWLWTVGRGDASTGPPRVVVLPFENLGSPDDEYFADGITEEITSRLARISGLVVISRTSAILYKNSDKPLRQIGSELDVRYVLEGTVRTDRSAGGAGQVRVTPQLIRVADDAHLWTEPYSAGIVPGEIFQVQADIAEQVAQAMNVTLIEPERRALAARPTVSPEAYDYYLRGIDYQRRSDTEPDQRNAVRMYERAVAVDSTFALAYAALGQQHAELYWYFFDRSPSRLAEAKKAIDRALDLDPDLPEAHVAQGFYHYWGLLAYDEALAEFRIAQRLRPHDAPFAQMAYVQRRQGKFDDAVQNMRTAVALDPRSAQLAYELAQTLVLAGHDRDAERYYDQATSVGGGFSSAYSYKARHYLNWEASIPKARAVLESPAAPAGDPLVQYLTVLVEILDGRSQEALDRLDHDVPGDAFESQMYFVPRSQLKAQIYGLMNRLDLSRLHYDSARVVVQQRLETQPDEANLHSAIGIALAGLGRKAEAIAEARKAVELLPVTKEAWRGLYRLEDLARVYVMVGEYDAALDQLERLVSLPGGKSIPFLKLDQVWEPIRAHPRFRALLGKAPER